MFQTLLVWEHHLLSYYHSYHPHHHQGLSCGCDGMIVHHYIIAANNVIIIVIDFITIITFMIIRFVMLQTCLV